jgi:DNA-binding NarL/FixJ family response regulator
MEGSNTTRIGLLEDHTVIREMVASFLGDLPGFDVLFSTADPDEAWTCARLNRPRVVIVDLDLGDTSGFTFLERMQALAPYTRCLVFTSNKDIGSLQKAVRLKAAGYVYKNAGTDTFLAALKAVASGRVHYPRDITSVVVA